MSAPKIPSFREALRLWNWLGWASFGGPAAQIALLHEEVVTRRRWLEEGAFLRALNYCMLLPGPEAQQLVTYTGYRLHGLRGALAAGGLFVLPSVMILWVLAFVYAQWGGVPQVQAFFRGLQPAVLALVACALWRLGAKVLRSVGAGLLAAGALGAIVLGVPFPAVVVGALLLGAALQRVAPAGADAAAPAPAEPIPEHLRPRLGRVAWLMVAHAALLVAPVAVAAAIFGPDHLLVRVGLFFGRAAFLTFGGAYAVLPYVAEHAVEDEGWLPATTMITGLGLAESTPGPLIMVVQWVGFHAGWNDPQPLAPWAMATLAALLTTWMTFVPCFAFILIGAPFVEASGRLPALQGALAGVSAAVVGVIAALFLWFGHHVAFAGGDPAWPALLLAAGCAWVLLRRWAGSATVVLGCGALGVLLHLIGWA